MLVVAAHPDDEVLGCGGTIAWHVARGDHVHVLMLGDGVTGRSAIRKYKTSKLKKQRETAALEANGVLGSFVELAGLPDNRFDSVDLLDIVQRIEDTKREVQPQIVYTHHRGDLNIDHRRVNQAVLTAFRPQPGELCSALFFFEVNSSTEWNFSMLESVFVPQRAVEITPFWNLKIKALECYKQELRERPHPRSLESIAALARWRGAIFGMVQAEVFEVGYIKEDG